MEIKTFREINHPKAEQIISDLRSVFPEKRLADYDCIFYNDGSQEDFHSRAVRIPSLLGFMIDTGLLRFWHNTAIISSLNGILLHSDGDPRFSYSLLFPIWNTKNTYTEFYTTDAAFSPTTTNNADHDIHYDLYEEGNHQFIDAVELKYPTIVNTDTPHRVVQPNGSPVRVTMSMRLHGDKKDVEQVLAKIFQ